ncbi:MAG: hypothetical protein JKY53_00060 [Flavobacteriales bacterium]|nr:hypothetical protein [Flavobacteriales bacterium]
MIESRELQARRTLSNGLEILSKDRLDTFQKCYCLTETKGFKTVVDRVPTERLIMAVRNVTNSILNDLDHKSG